LVVLYSVIKEHSCRRQKGFERGSSERRGIPSKQKNSMTPGRKKDASSPSKERKENK